MNPALKGRRRPVHTAVTHPTRSEKSTDSNVIAPRHASRPHASLISSSSRSGVKSRLLNTGRSADKEYVHDAGKIEVPSIVAGRPRLRPLVGRACQRPPG